MPTDDPLAPLLAGTLAGDRDALNRLLGRVRPYMHALVRHRLGPDPGGRIDQSSVVQKCLLRIAERHHQLHTADVPAFLGWVGQVVRNLLADEFRLADRRPGPAGSGVVGALTDPGPLPGSALEREEAAVRVADALGRLPDRYRQVLELRFMDQLSDDEVGRRVGASPGAVRVLRLRALRQLRGLLGGDAVPEDRP